MSNSNKTLSRNEFRELIINPLEKAFGLKVYWNGSESKKAGLGELTGNCLGTSFIERDNFPIVIRFSKNNLSVLDTLIHEIAHSCLHGLNSYGFELCDYAQEIEAETVSFRVFESLGLVSQGQSSCIEEYELKYRNKYGHDYKNDTRLKLVNNLSDKIIGLLKKSLKDIKALSSKNTTQKRLDYKYMVQCEICGTKWYYKRKTNIIKKDAEDCWCGNCGKEKSLNELTVLELN